jgi:cytochrome c-type biogenesis protein
VVAACIVLLLTGLISSACAAPVVIEYYHLKGCPDCDRFKPLMSELEHDLGGSISLTYTDVGTPEGLDRWQQHGFHEIPAVVVDGTFKIPKEEITEENLRAAIEQSLAGAEPQENSAPINRDIPFAFSWASSPGSRPA